MTILATTFGHLEHARIIEDAEFQLDLLNDELANTPEGVNTDALEAEIDAAEARIAAADNHVAERRAS